MEDSACAMAGRLTDSGFGLHTSSLKCNKA
jgi:hypothetical protein